MPHPFLLRPQPDGTSRARALRRSAAVALALVAPLFSACATGPSGAPEATAPAGAMDTAAAVAPAGFRGIPASVRPTEDALEAAEDAELTGTELGTMWTFENPPREYWSQEYDFAPDSAWLEHVRLASLRYGEICSASFVSPDGLVMTNHHCARDCVEAVSTDETDYVEEGFHARSREEERICPGLSLDQLVSIQEVTGAVRARIPDGAGPEVAAERREAARDSIVEACEERGELRCQVVSLYHGGQYQLYRYRRIAPVKLVFAPELQAGYYGGDPDNFTYPRFNLDVAFVRAYRTDSTRAYRPDHWLEWNPEGAGEGDLVFVTGNPGSTSRLSTVSQLEYERRYRHPFLLDFLGEQLDFLERIADMGPDARRQVRDRIFSIENSLKALRGQLRGLRNPELMGRKIRWQRRLQQRVESDSSLAARYGDVWARMGEVQSELLETVPRVRMNDPSFVGEPLLGTAAQLVRVLRYGEAPDSLLPEGLDREQLRESRERLRSEFPSSRAQEGALLQIRMRLARRWLPSEAPFLAEAIRDGESPEEAANRLARETRLDRVGVRRMVLDAGTTVLDTTSDPLLRLAAGMESRMRELRPRLEALQAREERQAERLADALFAVFGTGIPPDATFTLRITDGEMRRYEYNGTFAPARTSIYGLYERAGNFADEMPWTLPASFREARDRVEMTTPLNFVTTNDITGGNSGSPMIDRQGRVVGIAFDGNIEQLPNEFLFRTDRARTVGVHAAGITEALRSVYGADRLLEEILGEGAAAEDSGGS